VEVLVFEYRCEQRLAAEPVANRAACIHCRTVLEASTLQFVCNERLLKHRLFTQMTNPRDLEVGREIYLFRARIQPQWEDVSNKNGGRWTIMVSSAGVVGGV
jgi:hypothetical protein